MDNYLLLIFGSGTILGVLVTAFSAEFRTWLETRRQNKKQLKSVLYHQIELFGTILALDNEFHEFYLQTMSQELKNLGIPFNQVEDVFSHVPKEIYSMLENIKADEIKDIVQKHEETILKLSEIEPLLASKLSYRSRMHMPQQMQLFVTEMNKIPSENTQTVEDFANHIALWQQVKARKKMIDSLDKGIVEIAWRISWKTWWKTKNKMKNWRKQIQDDIKDEVKEYISETINFSTRHNEKIKNEVLQALKAKPKD